MREAANFLSDSCDLLCSCFPPACRQPPSVKVTVEQRIYETYSLLKLYVCDYIEGRPDENRGEKEQNQVFRIRKKVARKVRVRRMN